ncbi:hypothetical protein A2311_03540 [candidate division WOR-1 bacterium RIFOXYB2_FULL_48_7]|uniref:Uncharacterized protein n=1 Tax=candidate division WOR-1 bacterium RIFOXYB2_FULL_48_7 TaxID=1802583 RepID=A0A1F4TSC6_UNCSA|nr:MAG: hypothetical protein A2311_03540 [candidate division WOR-1 bacterium RIFOXYB2_FULL_48_7]
MLADFPARCLGNIKRFLTLPMGKSGVMDGEYKLRGNSRAVMMMSVDTLYDDLKDISLLNGSRKKHEKMLQIFQAQRDICQELQDRITHETQEAFEETLVANYPALPGESREATRRRAKQDPEYLVSIAPLLAPFEALAVDYIKQMEVALTRITGLFTDPTAN